MVAVVSLSANAQAHKPIDLLANIELTATQRTSIESVKKVYDEKKKAVKKMLLFLMNNNKQKHCKRNR